MPEPVRPSVPETDVSCSQDGFFTHGLVLYRREFLNMPDEFIRKTTCLSFLK